MKSQREEDGPEMMDPAAGSRRDASAKLCRTLCLGEGGKNRQSQNEGEISCRGKSQRLLWHHKGQISSVLAHALCRVKQVKEVQGGLFSILRSWVSSGVRIGKSWQRGFGLKVDDWIKHLTLVSHSLSQRCSRQVNSVNEWNNCVFPALKCTSLCLEI